MHLEESRAAFQNNPPPSRTVQHVPGNFPSLTCIPHSQPSKEGQIEGTSEHPRPFQRHSAHSGSPPGSGEVVAQARGSFLALGKEAGRAGCAAPPQGTAAPLPTRAAPGPASSPGLCRPGALPTAQHGPRRQAPSTPPTTHSQPPTGHRGAPNLLHRFPLQQDSVRPVATESTGRRHPRGPLASQPGQDGGLTGHRAHPCQLSGCPQAGTENLPWVDSHPVGFAEDGVPAFEAFTI